MVHCCFCIIGNSLIERCCYPYRKRDNGDLIWYTKYKCDIFFKKKTSNESMF